MSNTVDKHTSKVVCALVQLGLYQFEIIRYPEYASILLKYTKLPYTKIHCWGDGIVHYEKNDGKIWFEGCTKRLSTIKSDILNKQ